MSALLQPDQSFKKIKLKVELPEPLVDEIDRYMDHSKIETRSSLIQKSLEYVMEKDRGFKQKQK